MSASNARPTRDSALEDALRRIRVLERLIRGGSASMPACLLAGNLHGQTIANGVSTFIPLSGLLAAPVNAGGVVDPDIYQGIKADNSVVPLIGANEPFAAVKFMVPGLYWVQVASGWWEDWGRVSVLPDMQHDDSDFSVLPFVFFGDSMRSTFIPPTSPPQLQMGVSYDNVYAIDDRAVNPRIRVQVNNTSGSDRTFNDTDRTGGGGLFIIRLSPFPDASPPL